MVLNAAGASGWRRTSKSSSNRRRRSRSALSQGLEYKNRVGFRHHGHTRRAKYPSLSAADDAKLGSLVASSLALLGSRSTPRRLSRKRQSARRFGYGAWTLALSGTQGISST